MVFCRLFRRYGIGSHNPQKPIKPSHGVACFHFESCKKPLPLFHSIFCREVFDVWISKIEKGEVPSVPTADITRKLDSDFFHGRWAKATDRQRELLQVVSLLPNADQEFTVQEVVAASNEHLLKPFTASHVSQMLSSLSEAGLVYKNRHGKYSLAVPLLGQFIQRQTSIDLQSS
jgi:hypothetical protein